jgi:dihydrodipicolinate synthase/N-acetylneuraminate lyase
MPGGSRDGSRRCTSEIVAAFGAVGVKAALDLLGWAGGAPRAPLRALGEKDRRQVARVMQEAGIL